MHESRDAGQPTAGEDPTRNATRRGFVEWAALACGSIVAAVPLLAGLFAFLDPLRGKRRPPLLFRRSGDGKEGFLRIAPLNAMAVGDPPQRFPVIDDRQNAWNFEPQQAVGAVYVERTGDADVRVFNATCPHAGCSVSCNGSAYHCPCHNSAFNLDGSKRQSESGRENPSPRPLDRLAVDEQKLSDGEIWVEFMNFYTGIEKKKPKQ